MKTFLLLMLSLMAGCQAGSEVKGCREGWVEFTCNANGNYEGVVLEGPRKNNIRTDQKNEWVNKDNISLYHDTRHKKLQVVIKHLQPQDFGEYECTFYQQQSSKKDKEVEVKEGGEKHGCQKSFTQTAYRTAKTTIRCDDPGHKVKFRVNSICKERDAVCDDILSTKSSPKSNGSFTLTETNSGFTVSISDVSTNHAGVYWCTASSGNYRAALRKIKLEVKVPRPTLTPSIVSSTPHHPVATSDVSSTQSTTVFSSNTGGSSSTVIIIVAICIAVLLLLLVLVLIFKHIKNRETQNNKEDGAYEEIQERPHKPDSGTPPKTIYVTANFPTSLSSASHHYSNFQNSKISGNTHSAVKYSDQHPTNLTVNHPPTIPEDPFYSTLKKPQEP